MVRHIHRDAAGRTSGACGASLTKADVAEALGVSVDFVEDHVWHELRLVRRGRKTLCPVRELEGWLEQSAARTIPDAAA